MDDDASLYFEGNTDKSAHGAAKVMFSVLYVCHSVCLQKGGSLYMVSAPTPQSSVQRKP